MKKLLLLPLILLTGCGSLSSSKGEKHQMELSLHKVRTEVEDLKHDLNTYEIEHHVLEGKHIDQEQTILSLKQQVTELKSGKLDSFLQELQILEKKLLQLSKKQEKMVADIRQLSSHANDTTTALSQYKDKIDQFEKSILVQNQQIGDMTKLKDGLTKLSQFDSLKTYSVKSGDSLEKIAREHGTDVEEIKKLNQMSSDLIVVDQQLYIP